MYNTESFRISNEQVRGTEVLRLFNHNYSTGELEELDMNDYEVVDIVEAKRIQEQRKAYLEKKALLASLDNCPFVWVIYQTATRLLE